MNASSAEYSDPDGEEMAILEAVRDGNQDAFAGIVRRYQGRLFNYLYRFTRSREDSEDLVADTLFQAFTQLRSCRELKKFRAWLFRIAHNIGVNFWRKKNRERTWTTRLENLASEVASWAASHEEESAKKEEGMVLEKALRELPEHYRSALFLYYYEDFSYQEIVDILGVPLSSVKTRLFRGRKLLEAKVKDYFAEPLGELFPAEEATINYASTFPKTSHIRTDA